jgi:hypothetical protein
MQKGCFKNILAGIMILLFALSITPKIMLHDLIANHKDASPSSFGSNAQLTASGLHCDVENLVVEGPFLFGNITVTFNIPVVFVTYQNKSIHNFCSTDNFVSCLRGPPYIS